MRIKQTISLVVLLSGILLAGALIPGGLSVRSDGNNITISWQAVSETNLKQYVIERKSGNSDYVEIAIINSNPSMKYEYVDNSVFKIIGSTYKYRLKIVDNDGSYSYLEQVGSVFHNVSSVKRTWGSIKALFR